MGSHQKSWSMIMGSRDRGNPPPLFQEAVLEGPKRAANSKRRQGCKDTLTKPTDWGSVQIHGHAVDQLVEAGYCPVAAP